MWTSKIPTNPGTYWFYGDPYMGQMGQDYTNNATINVRLSIIEVSKTSNSLIGVCNGHFVTLKKFNRNNNRSQGVVGLWNPLQKPDLPESPEIFKEFKVDFCES